MPLDAFVPGDDAGAMADDDAGTMTDDDAGTMTDDDAGAMADDDAGTTTGVDAGASDAGPTDAGRGDAGGAAMDSGTTMPPSNDGSCSCRAAGSGERTPLAALGALALLGLVLRRSKRR
jgi:MYXO-CTERM domain-containing protein